MWLSFFLESGIDNRLYMVVFVFVMINLWGCFDNLNRCNEYLIIKIFFLVFVRCCLFFNN